MHISAFSTLKHGRHIEKPVFRFMSGVGDWQNEDRWQERFVLKVQKCCKVGSRAAERKPVRGKTTRGLCLAHGGG